LKILVAILPFLLDILLKISAFLLEPREMMRALEALLRFPKPQGESFNIDRDQRILIVKSCANASLRPIAILTIFISSCDAFIFLYEWPSTLRLAGIAAIIVTSGLLLIWILMTDVQGLSEEIPRLGIEKATLLILVLCLYDILLGGVSIWALSGPSST
jgi:hypothetical protein